MRKLITVTIILTLILMASIAFSAPTEITYQGRITDDTGVINETDLTFIFRLYADQSSTDILWEEVQVVTVTEGLFSVRLGSITPLDMSAMPVHPDFLWLGIQVGSDAELSPRTQLSSVPAAAVASSLRGNVSTNNSVLIMTDSLGDTTIIWDANARQGIINDLHPPGNNTSTRFAPGVILLTDPVGDTTYHLQNNADVTVEKFQHKQEFGPVQQQRQGVTDSSSFVEMSAITDTDSSLILIHADTGGVSLSFNKVDMVDDAELLALIELEKSIGASITLRRLDTDDDDDGILTLEVDNTGSAALYMNKGELVDAIASSASLVTDTAKAQLHLSKADAKRALEAISSSTSVGLYLIDSTLNDSGLIDLEIDDSGPNMRLAEDDDPYGDGISSRFEFTVTPSRMELAKSDPGGTNLLQSITLDMEKFTRASIDPADPDSTFVLNFANREMSLRTPEGGGLISNRVEISDLDLDGTLDLRVDGDIGVGTSTPSEKLHVVGNICATGTIGVCSDERFKQDISPLSDAIGTINQLQGINYSWKRDEFPNMKFSDERQIGFIAQEIKEILPSVVSKGADGFYTVDYSKLTPVLVEAIKEQQKQIDLQQKQIDELKKLVQQLANKANTNESTFGMK